MSEKVAEATECYKNAEKSLKTGFLKWRPDFDNAANEYARAATCYKAARLPEKSLEAHLKAAECHYQNHSFFSAAKSYEQAALICKELNDWDNLMKYFERACALFREHGVPDTAALTLNRGAGIIETKFPEKAASWYGQACEVTMLEDRPRQAAEYANKAARLCLKLKRYNEASDYTKKALNHLVEADDMQACGRLVVAIVLIQLGLDDIVAAQKSFREGKCYVEQQELYTLNQLLDGYDQMDPALVHQALNSPFIKSLDNELTKLARSLQQRFVVKTPESTAESQADTIDEAGALL